MVSIVKLRKQEAKRKKTGGKEKENRRGRGNNRSEGGRKFYWSASESSQYLRRGIWGQVDFRENSHGSDPAPGLCMFPKRNEVDETAQRVIACAIEVHRTMGPGLLESIYRECMTLECRRQQLHIDSEQVVPVTYKDTTLVSRFRIDLLVERTLILELKAVEAIQPIHKAQVISYLKLTGHPAGLLINFNQPTLIAGLHRLDHPDRYAQRKAAGKFGQQGGST